MIFKVKFSSHWWVGFITESELAKDTLEYGSILQAKSKCFPLSWDPNSNILFTYFYLCIALLIFPPLRIPRYMQPMDTELKRGI